MKYFIQIQSKCSQCKRKVDVVSTDKGEGFLFSRHFRSTEVREFSWCENSLGVYK